MPETPMNQQDFSRLLPFYLNRTLSADDQARMEHYLAEHPEARMELEFEELLRDAVKSVEAPRPESVRLQELLNALENEPQHAKSPLQAILSWWRNLRWDSRLSVPVPAFAMAMGLVMALVVRQAVLLSQVGLFDNNGGYRGGNPACASTNGLKLLIKPDARMEDLVLTLRKVEGSLRAGPTETGEVWISIPESLSLQNAEQLLLTSPIVDGVVSTPLSLVDPACARR